MLVCFGFLFIFQSLTVSSFEVLYGITSRQSDMRFAQTSLHSLKSFAPNRRSWLALSLSRARVFPYGHTHYATLRKFYLMYFFVFRCLFIFSTVKNLSVEKKLFFLAPRAIGAIERMKV